MNKHRHKWEPMEATPPGTRGQPFSPWLNAVAAYGQGDLYFAGADNCACGSLRLVERDRKIPGWERTWFWQPAGRFWRQRIKLPDVMISVGQRWPATGVTRTGDD